MTGKHSARADYFEGAKAALDEHLQSTEQGLRSLTGVSAEKIDKLVATVRKDHRKLVAKISQRAAAEARRV